MVFQSSDDHVHSKKILGRRWKNGEICNRKMRITHFNFLSNMNKFYLLQTNFWSKFGQKFVEIIPKVGLKQVNRIYPLQTSKFFHRRPKNFFECIQIARCACRYRDFEIVPLFYKSFSDITLFFHKYLQKIF